ncbi:MAG TPA: WG repeat-containing protein [Bacteroidia bacterium]|jgi:hypothetical protein|nr:WG repeat-containing protein [Bacteroidia bacterium]
MKKVLPLLFVFISTHIFAQHLPALIPYMKDGKYGLSDSTRRIIVQPLYDDILFADSLDFVGVELGAKWGIIDHQGNVIIPPQYDEINFGSDYKYFITTNKNKYGAVSLDGKVTIPCVYDEFADREGMNIAFRKKKKYGIVSVATGKELIPARSTDWVAEYSNSLFTVYKNKTYTLVNAQGKPISPMKYTSIETSGYAFVVAYAPNYAYADIYDTIGRPVLKKFKGSVSCAVDSLISLAGYGNDGYDDGPMIYSVTGRKIFPVGLTSVDGEALCAGDSLPFVTISKEDTSSQSDAYYYDYGPSYKSGIATWKGDVIIPAIYNEAYVYRIGNQVMFYLSTDTSMMLTDTHGNTILSLSTDSGYVINSFYDHVLMVSKNGKYGSMDYSGHVIIPFRYDDLLYDEKYDLYYYKRHLGWGIMDAKGKPLTKAIYSEVDQFGADSTAMVRDIYGEFWNLVDLKGRLLLRDSVYDDLYAVTPFSDPDYTYTEDGYYGDEGYYYGGDYSYSAPVSSHTSYYRFGHDGHFGIVTSKGKVIVPDTCEDVQAFGRDGLFEITSRGKYALCDSTGKHVTKLYPYLEDSYTFGMIRMSDKEWQSEYVINENGDEVYNDHRDTVYYGYISSNAKEIVPPIYISELPSAAYDDYGSQFPISDTLLYMIRKDSLIDVYDINGHFHKGLSGKYRSLQTLYGETPLCQITSPSGKVGLLDTTGRTVLPAIYNSIELFMPDSLYLVAMDSLEHYHYFDRKGNIVKFLEVDSASYSSGYDHQIMVNIGGKNGLISGDGKTLIPLKYDNIYGIAPGYYVVSSGDRSGVLNDKGEVVIPFEYYNISEMYQEGLIKVFLTADDYSSGRVRLIDLHGTKYWE